MEVKEICWLDGGDAQCDGHEDEEEKLETVGQNTSMFHQFLYVAWLRVTVRDILWANGEQ